MSTCIRSTICSSKEWILPIPIIENSDFGSTIGLKVDYIERESDMCCIAPRPLSVSFSCQRNVNDIDDSIKSIYNSIISNQIHTQLTPRDSGVCMANEVMNHCGNKRGDLSECACNALNRIRNLHHRKNFEDQVINLVRSFLAQNPYQSQLNIAMFASGMLHGESVLVIKLIHALKNIRYSGEVNLFLIDRQYSPSIAAANNLILSEEYKRGFRWERLIGNRRDIQQFLKETALCVPPSISIGGAVFGDANDYIWRAQNDRCRDFKHDILVGADIEETEEIFREIKLHTDRSSLPGVVLIRGPGDKPNICTVGFASGDFYCTQI